MRVRGVELAIEICEERVASENLIDSKEAGFEAVVHVGGVVGDFVDEVDELRFERRAQVEKIFGELGILGGGCNRGSA